MSDAFAWTPTRDVIESSNIWRFMRKHGIGNLAEMRARSTSDIAWFWDAIVKELPIDFFKPYHTVYDDSAGIAWTKWFIGGELNLCHNCVDRHALFGRREKTAILWEGEDGTVLNLSYGDLHTETCRLANALRRLGVGLGDRVG